MMTPDEHAAKAEELLAFADQADARGSHSENIDRLIARAHVHAILATRPYQPAIPDRIPTEADMRNALVEFDLTKFDDGSASRTRLVHLIACLPGELEREEWIRRAAAISTNTEAELRRFVKRCL